MTALASTVVPLPLLAVGVSEIIAFGAVLIVSVAAGAFGTAWLLYTQKTGRSPIPSLKGITLTRGKAKDVADEPPKPPRVGI